MFQRGIYSLLVSGGKLQSFRVAHNSDCLRSADPGDPISSESIGGGRDVAMGVIETSLAALQAGSSLVTNVPFISPVASLILQALQMRGVRERLVFQFVSGVNIVC